MRTNLIKIKIQYDLNTYKIQNVTHFLRMNAVGSEWPLEDFLNSFSLDF